MAANPGAVVDAVSFHAYDMLMGDLAMMRANLAQFYGLISKHGLTSLLVWQTEQGVECALSGVFYPRRARWKMLQLLLQESYGIPKEQDYHFYDGSHGFWSIPTFWECGNTGLLPHAVMIRTFSEEVYGCNFNATISFGTYGDKMYFGGYWQNPTTGAGVAIFMSPCPILGSTQQVTLTVTGTTAPLTAVDAWGNSSLVNPIGGRVTLPISDTPTYLQLPNGVSVSAYSFGTWLPLTARDLATALPKGAPTGVADGTWQNGYDGQLPLTPLGAGQLSYLYEATSPETGTYITFNSAVTFNRVVIWCGMLQQKAGALTDFDIQTSSDGVTWTSRATVAAIPPATIGFVTGSLDMGCTYESYWTLPWIFDVPLGTVTARYIRLNTRGASYGVNPDATCQSANGVGSATQTYAISEIGVFYNDTVLFPVNALMTAIDTIVAKARAEIGWHVTNVERLAEELTVHALAKETGNPDALREWYNEGADGAINWGEPGDFDACVAVAGKYLDDPEGYCNERHQDATGGPPGTEDAEKAARSAWANHPNHAYHDKLVAHYAPLIAAALKRSVTGVRPTIVSAQNKYAAAKAKTTKAGGDDIASETLAQRIAREAAQGIGMSQAELQKLMTGMAADSYVAGVHTAMTQVGSSTVYPDGFGTIAADTSWADWEPGWGEAADLTKLGGGSPSSDSLDITIKGITQTNLDRIANAVGSGIG